jgi:hypothetical protein
VAKLKRKKKSPPTPSITATLSFETVIGAVKDAVDALDRDGHHFQLEATSITTATCRDETGQRWTITYRMSGTEAVITKLTPL